MLTVLPFGLATACYAFTKILRLLVKYWWSQGLRAFLYLDNRIVAVKGKEAAVEASRIETTAPTSKVLVEPGHQGASLSGQRHCGC